VFSLETEDGLLDEVSNSIRTDDPATLLRIKEDRCRLCHALNSLPKKQGERIEARYVDRVSVKTLSETEGASERNIRKSVYRGLSSMRKYLNMLDDKGTEIADFCPYI
jgi:RNA polymerase sigma-70 factor (ECF subfamily)